MLHHPKPGNGHVKVTAGCARLIFSSILHNFCDFLFGLLHHKDPSAKRSTLKGNNLLQLGANYFLLV